MILYSIFQVWLVKLRFFKKRNQLIWRKVACLFIRPQNTPWHAQQLRWCPVLLLWCPLQMSNTNVHCLIQKCPLLEEKCCAPSKMKFKACFTITIITRAMSHLPKNTGLVLHRGNEGDCLRTPWSLPWCPLIAPVEIYHFLIGCPLPRGKCISALALSKKPKQTGLKIQWRNL